MPMGRKRLSGRGVRNPNTLKESRKKYVYLKYNKKEALKSIEIVRYIFFLLFLFSLSIAIAQRKSLSMTKRKIKIYQPLDL
jgi:hypothetical protein